jgi:hypothetical protein
MTPRRWFAIFFAIGLVIFVLFYLPYFNPGTPSNQDLKRAGSAERVQAIFLKWADAGKEAARHNLMLDWLFIIVYTAMWIAAGQTFWPHHALTKIAVAAGLAGAAADVAENLCLWMMLNGEVTDQIAQACKRVSAINVVLFFLTGSYFVVAAIASTVSRHGWVRRFSR